MNTNYESPSAEIVEIETENEFLSGSINGTIEGGSLGNEEDF